MFNSPFARRQSIRGYLSILGRAPSVHEAGEGHNESNVPCRLIDHPAIEVYLNIYLVCCIHGKSSNLRLIFSSFMIDKKKLHGSLKKPSLALAQGRRPLKEMVYGSKTNYARGKSDYMADKD